MQENININNKIIGPGAPTFVIAEISGNHGGEIKNAIKLIDEAKSIGADAVKLQTYTADTLTLDINSDDFKIVDEKSLWKGENLYSLYQKAYTPWEWHEKIFIRSKELGMICFSTPFDDSAVDFLVSSNHVYAFALLSFLAFINYYKNQKIIVIGYLFFISIFLELSHFYIPNRGFQFSDLFGNIIGVLISLSVFNLIINWRKK